MKKLLIAVLLLPSFLFCEQKHSVEFVRVPMEELVKFASKVSGLTFLYTPEELDRDVSFISSRPLTTSQLVEAVIGVLKNNRMQVTEKKGYLYITRDRSSIFEPRKNSPHIDVGKYMPTDEGSFFVQKLEYNRGPEIVTVLKQIASQSKGNISLGVKEGIDGMQWIESSNSLLFSADERSAPQIQNLIQSLDTELKQVFIEVLVLETSVKNSSKFGLQWAARGKFNDKLSFGASSFDKSERNLFKQAVESPSLADIPFAKGFDFGVIGDLILHKGKTFLTLGSLLDALQTDTDSTIVLNQKIIAQDGKESNIFFGDNIPFPGSFVETIGASQQTTSNIEYRDVGVSLKITPVIGKNGVITLDISEEITEATPTHISLNSSVHGIQTSKTNMLTRVHVPDQSFLVLSGMIRNNQTRHKTGVPCMGGLPLVGAFFSHNEKDNEKRNVVVFVRPRIVNNSETYRKITESQEELYLKQSEDPKAFQNDLNILKQ